LPAPLAGGFWELVFYFSSLFHPDRGGGDTYSYAYYFYYYAHSKGLAHQLALDVWLNEYNFSLGPVAESIFWLSKC